MCAMVSLPLFFLFPDCFLHRNFYSLMSSDTISSMAMFLRVNSTGYPLYQKLEHSIDVPVYFLKHPLLTPFWIWNMCIWPETNFYFLSFVQWCSGASLQYNELFSHSFSNPHIESHLQGMCSHATSILLQQMQSRGEL